MVIASDPGAADFLPICERRPDGAVAGRSSVATKKLKSGNVPPWLVCCGRIEQSNFEPVDRGLKSGVGGSGMPIAIQA
jgi:hypothetical protein